MQLLLIIPNFSFETYDAFYNLYFFNCTKRNCLYSHSHTKPPQSSDGVVVFSNLILGIKGYMNVVIVVLGDAATVWHEVPGVGWSVDAVEWGVEALLPDDI